jgi:UrcA family protein
MIARIIALGLMSAAAAASQAETSLPDSDVPAVRVDYADLDLNTEQGATRLYKRIAGAAKRVCPSSSGLELRASQVAQRCISAAISRAVAEVDSPQLAKVGALRTRRATQG